VLRNKSKRWWKLSGSSEGSRRWRLTWTHLCEQICAKTGKAARGVKFSSWEPFKTALSQNIHPKSCGGWGGEGPHLYSWPTVPPPVQLISRCSIICQTGINSATQELFTVRTTISKRYNTEIIKAGAGRHPVGSMMPFIVANTIVANNTVIM
jgi:hypothetical protein